MIRCEKSVVVNSIVELVRARGRPYYSELSAQPGLLVLYMTAILAWSSEDSKSIRNGVLKSLNYVIEL